MVAEEPVPAGLLAQVLELPVVDVTAGLKELSGEYEAAGRGFCLREVAGGWRFYSHPESVAYVEKFVLAAENPRLSSAAVETLAIVAYRQPISRAQLAEIRGVNSDAVLRTLSIRGLVEPVGTDAGPGQATLYGTTRAFLERMGLRSIAELPPLADFVPSAEEPARWDAALSTGGADADPDLAARVRHKIREAAADLGGPDPQS
jgi:segregation and condensation protein B